MAKAKMLGSGSRHQLEDPVRPQGKLSPRPAPADAPLCAILTEHANARGQRATGVDHVVHQNGVRAADVADELHVAARVVKVAVHTAADAAVDDGGKRDAFLRGHGVIRVEGACEAQLKVSRLFHARLVRRHHHKAAFGAQLVLFPPKPVPKPLRGRARRLQVVHHDASAEKALDLPVPWRLEVHRDNSIYPLHRRFSEALLHPGAPTPGIAPCSRA